MSSNVKVDTRVTVETPEGVDFQFLIAGPGKRSVSFFLDTLLKCGVIALCIFLMLIRSNLSELPSGTMLGIGLLIWFFLSWLYGSCFEAFWNGQTPGKRSQNLRVVRTNGTPIGWFEAFGRNLLLFVDGMLVLGPIALNTVGLISMSSNRRMQRLGDLVFDTMVIDETREFINRNFGVTQGVELIARSECTRRYHVPERTLAVIERLFEGDRVISDGRREEIARPLGLSLRNYMGIEEAPPDPQNPNSFFVQSPVKHTIFLRRILKSFSDDPQDAAERKREFEERMESEGRSRAESRSAVTAPSGGDGQTSAPADSDGPYSGPVGTASSTASMMPVRTDIAVPESLPSASDDHGGPS